MTRGIERSKFQWFPVTPVAEDRISARSSFSPKIIVVWLGPGASRIMIENELLFLIKNNNRDSSFVIIVEVAVARSPLGRDTRPKGAAASALASIRRGNTGKQTSVIERCHFVAYSFVFFFRALLVTIPRHHDALSLSVGRTRVPPTRSKLQIIRSHHLRQPLRQPVPAPSPPF